MLTITTCLDWEAAARFRVRSHESSAARSKPCNQPTCSRKIVSSATEPKTKSNRKNEGCDFIDLSPETSHCVLPGLPEKLAETFAKLSARPRWPTVCSSELLSQKNLWSRCIEHSSSPKPTIEGFRYLLIDKELDRAW